MPLLLWVFALKSTMNMHFSWRLQRAGGSTRSGVDCSGLTMAIYARIYDKQLHRRSVEQYERDVQLKERSQLQQGDLVFFRTPNSGEQCGHVGIFLKDNKFIHAGSRGVVVESLEGSYWQQFWLAGGKVCDKE